jgi:hypothetical protein
VSEAGGAFASAHDRADIDGESDEVEDLEDSIPYIEDFEEWPDAPVMLCPDPAAAQQVRGSVCMLQGFLWGVLPGQSGQLLLKAYFRLFCGLGKGGNCLWTA